MTSTAPPAPSTPQMDILAEVDEDINLSETFSPSTHNSYKKKNVSLERNKPTAPVLDEQLNMSFGSGGDQPLPSETVDEIIEDLTKSPIGSGSNMDDYDPSDEASRLETFIAKVGGREIALFRNDGNACFATTTLFLLNQLQPFRKAVRDSQNRCLSKDAENRSKPEEKILKICSLLEEARSQPSIEGHCHKIIEEIGMKPGEQADAAEFLGKLLERSVGEKFNTCRIYKETCVDCGKKTNLAPETPPCLRIPVKEGETESLQAELGKLLDGISNVECTLCNKWTIHQVNFFYGS